MLSVIRLKGSDLIFDHPYNDDSARAAGCLNEQGSGRSGVSSGAEERKKGTGPTEPGRLVWKLTITTGVPLPWIEPAVVILLHSTGT